MADETVDVGDIVEHLCALFSRWATEHKEINAFRDNVEVLRGKGYRQALFTFRFMTREFLIVAVEVDMEALLKEGRPHIEKLVAQLVDDLEHAREERQREFRLVLNANPGAEARN